MYITLRKSRATVKLLDNLTVSPDTMTVSMASCAV